MLVGDRPILMNGVQVSKAPLIVPSFSSKGFPSVKAMIGILSEYITESSLVSLYDIHYGHVYKKNNFADLLFIDSGGYEASIDTDLSDAKRLSGKPNSWPHRTYLSALKKLKFPPETIHVVVNYDNARSRLAYKEQVNRALSDFDAISDKEFVSEILFKPENDSTLLDVKKVIGQLTRIKSVDVVGFTEKELGQSTLDRMYAIAQIRRAMQGLGLDKPIHIFGALDPISVPLYFVSGADIFDGLTWLRYALFEGKAVYIQNYINLNNSLDARQSVLETKTWIDNIMSVNNLQRQMRTFIVTKDFDTFDYHGELIRKSSDHLRSMLEGK